MISNLEKKTRLRCFRSRCSFRSSRCVLYASLLLVMLLALFLCLKLTRQSHQNSKNRQQPKKQARKISVKYATEQTKRNTQSDKSASETLRASFPPFAFPNSKHPPHQMITGVPVLSGTTPCLVRSPPRSGRSSLEVTVLPTPPGRCRTRWRRKTSTRLPGKCLFLGRKTVSRESASIGS